MATHWKYLAFLESRQHGRTLASMEGTVRADALLRSTKTYSSAAIPAALPSLFLIDAQGIWMNEKGKSIEQLIILMPLSKVLYLKKI